MSFLEIISSIFLLLLSFIYLPLYFICHVLIQFLYLPRWIHRYLIHPKTVLKKRYWTKTGYALVTGATDGTGTGFAEELAKDGWNVILHGRNEGKLTPIIENLRTLYPNQTFLPLLLDCDTLDLYTELPRHLQSYKNLDIRVLINNAGNLHSCAHFQDIPLSESRATLQTNLIFPTVITWCLLNLKNLAEPVIPGPKVVTPEASPSCKSTSDNTLSEDVATYATWRDPNRTPLRLIINISSIASFFAIHRAIPYSPAKAYLNSFSSFLRYTLVTEGVEVMNVPTGPMNTKMWPGKRDYWMCLERNDFARRVMNKIGLARLGTGWRWWGWRGMGLGVDEPVGAGVWVYWWHQLLILGQPLFPSDVWSPTGDWFCQLLGYKPKPAVSAA